MCYPWIDVVANLTVEPRKGDDPIFHQNRVRAHQHISGTWPTHVYIEFEPTLVDRKIFEKALEDARKFFPDTEGLLFSDFGVSRELHISLSRPIMLSSETKDTIRQELGAIKAKRMSLKFDQFEMLTNDDRTRTFLVATCIDNPELLSLSKKIDQILRVYNLPVLYEVIFLPLWRGFTKVV